MARVHGRQQGRTLGATDFTDDDAVGPHTQAGFEAVVHVNFRRAVGTLSPGLHAQPVIVVDLQFSRVLHREQTARPRNVHP